MLKIKALLDFPSTSGSECRPLYSCGHQYQVYVILEHITSNISKIFVTFWFYRSLQKLRFGIKSWPCKTNSLFYKNLWVKNPKWGLPLGRKPKYLLTPPLPSLLPRPRMKTSSLSPHYLPRTGHNGSAKEEPCCFSGTSNMYYSY